MESLSRIILWGAISFLSLFFIISNEYYSRKIKKMSEKMSLYGLTKNLITSKNEEYVSLIESLGVGGSFEQIRSMITEDELSEQDRKKLYDICGIRQYKIAFPGYVYPVQDIENAFILSAGSEYGFRTLNNYHFHFGNDIRTYKGFDLVAVGDGIVEAVGYSRIGGNYVKIIHQDKKGMKKSFYGHCSIIYVKPNDVVKQGDVIALIGNSGDPKWCKGYHLHFGWYVWNGNRWESWNYFSNCVHRRNYVLKK